LQSGISRPLYQQLILDESMGFRGNRLTHHFNVSLLKKRILMISKQKSGNWAKARYLFILPALFALLFLLSVPTFSSAFLDNVKTGFGIPSVPVEPGAMIQDKAPQGKTAKKDSCNAAVVKPGEEVYKVVEKMPEFQGGMKALQEFLLKNIKYPEAAKKKQTQGTVFVAFVVGKDGTIGNVKVIRGIGNGCDEEAVRVVKLMPKWIPGEEKGKPVNVVFNIPIKFMLGDKKKEEQKEKQ
jgi:TonB family protein